MANPRLTIGLLVWNGAKFLPALFESIKKQTFRDFELIVLDNGSTDDSARWLRAQCPLLSPELAGGGCRFFQNPTNVGFAVGQNQIFALSPSEFYLVLNQDVVLTPDCLRDLISHLEAHENVASIGPKLFKWDGVQNQPSDIIDSLGLKVMRNRRMVEMKSIDQSQLASDGSMLVFGVSGALALYRRSAITAVGGLFDPIFFSYKEDVDLAYRLNNAGFENRVLTSAIAYHVRTGSDSGSDNDLDQARNKRRQSDLVRYYSYRNHLILLLKNESWHSIIVDFPWILWYELKKFVYYLIYEPAVLKGLLDIWRHRREIKNHHA